jgi:hypothetical protein
VATTPEGEPVMMGTFLMACWGLVLNFDSIEGKKYKRDAKASTSQREQYKGTVHLFIDTGRNL